MLSCSQIGRGFALILETDGLQVHVPRLDGKKVGVLATRTPHRPLPIGLTVAKVRQDCSKRCLQRNVCGCFRNSWSHGQKNSEQLVISLV